MRETQVLTEEKKIDRYFCVNNGNGCYNITTCNLQEASFIRRILSLNCYSLLLQNSCIVVLLFRLLLETYPRNVGT